MVCSLGTSAGLPSFVIHHVSVPRSPCPAGPSFHHSCPCCSVGGAVVVVIIVVVIPSLSPSPIPHHSRLHPRFCALIASPWPSLSSSFLSSPHHLLIILPPPPLTHHHCRCHPSVFGVVTWQGVLTWLGGAVFSLHPCLIILLLAISTCDQPRKQ